MLRARYSRKIGGAFLLLSLLTAVSGSLGLLFAHTVLSILRSVPEEGQPIVANLEELDYYLRQAVLLSRAVSSGEASANKADLRSELERLRQSSRTVLANLRLLIEDHSLHEEFASAAREHEELVTHTRELLERQLEAISIRSGLAEIADKWQQNWSRVAAGMTDFVDNTEGSSILTSINIEHLWAVMAVTIRLDAAFIEANSLQSRLFSFSDVDELEPVMLRLDEIRDRITELSAALVLVEAQDGLSVISDPLDGLVSSVRHSYDLLAGESGLLEIVARLIEAERNVASVEVMIGQESEDVITSLDRILRIAYSLTFSGTKSSVIRTIPTLLTVTVIGTISLSILLTILFTRSFIHPVNQLIKATQAVADGNLGGKAVVRSGDELEFLATSFNRMVEQVSEAKNRMTEMNVLLEDEVAKRTLDLRREIDEKMIAEQTALRNEQRYRTIVENFPRGIILLIDRSGRCLSAGGEALSYFDINASRVVGRSMEESIPRLHDALREELESRTGWIRKSIFGRTIDGNEWHVSIVPNSGSSYGWSDTLTIILLDVSEEKKNRDMLVMADKMATLGVLVAGVAHEINNPNQAVSMAGYILKRTWAPIDILLSNHPRVHGDSLFGGIRYEDLRRDMPGYIDSIVDGSNRIEHIVRSLKDYARDEPKYSFSEVDINSIVGSAVFLISSIIEETTDNFVMELDREVPRVNGDPIRLEQVVVNIIQNACQALDDKSKSITVRTMHDRDTDRVMLEITDEGVGIPSEIIGKITDPFFTTRRSSGGTGLGLSVSTGIIREHRGEILFRSVTPEGTRVIVSLPAIESVRTAKEISHGRE